ncbi:hypothetical protein [Streptomyces sp. NPDC053079]|uniref:hypothetical protein n=1 Tax=Streptomyces sp. NPDC053079 TaxID=3365697 RepID=UPI0037CE32EF
MTTRIRINIPGSRPIPPVVLRTPVGDEAPAADAAPAPAPGGAAAERKENLPARRESLPTRPKQDRKAAAPAADAAADGAGSGDKTSDWFAPRKSSPAPPPAAGAARRQAAAGGKQPPPLPRRGAAGMGGAQRPPAHGGAAGTGAGPWPGDASTTGAVPQAPAPTAGAANGAAPWPGGAPAAPVDDWPANDPSTTAATPWPGDPSAGAMQHPAPGAATDGAAPWPGDPQTTGTTPWPGDSSTTGAMQQPPAPGGPANGAAPWPGGTPDAPVDDWPGGSSTTAATPWPGGEAPAGGNAPRQADPAPWPGSPAAPGGAPQARPAATQQFSAPTVGATIGGVPAGGAAFAGSRTDTPREGFPAVPGTPQGAGNPAAQGGNAQAKGKKKRGPKASAPAPAAGRTGETLVSGVPPVPPAAGQGAQRAVDSGAPRVPVPKPKPALAGGPSAAAPKAPAKSAPKSAAKSAPKKKGRSKLVLLGGGLVALVGLAYGAGLLLDHADVPNGTTVLGIDIGGKSKDQAVQTLDSALASRTGAPLKVTIGGKTADLKPSVAGLSIDTQATVRAAAGRDYNPVTVLSSLIGGSRTAEPTVVADEEKIAAALKTLAGETGTAKEGTIKFEPGKAVPVYGQPYEGVNVDASVKEVSKAFRERAATGKDKPITLQTSPQQPKVAKAEVDRMMKDFATPAMSGLVTIQTDPAHKIQFGPDRSLPKILSVKEVNGKLVENYDLEAIKELYGSAFNGVQIQRGNGAKTPVQPTDVAVALGKALRGKTPAERIGTIPLG